MQNRKAVSIALMQNFDDPDFFLVKRNPELKFFGDYYAFPGGTLDAEDSEIPVNNSSVFPKALKPYIVAATREVFEETGVLLTKGQENLSPENKLSYRNALLNDEITFLEILDNESLEVSTEPFRFLGEVLTPEFAPVRYDTKFFLVEIPDGQTPEVINGELVEGGFYTPARAISIWKKGGIDLVPPLVFMFLHWMSLPFEGALERILKDTQEYEAGKIHQIYFSPGIRMVPLKTRPIPPAAYTNCYVIGEKYLFLLDPGASNPDEQERLLIYLDSIIDKNHKLQAILLSHHHPDHVEAAVLCSSRYDVPIYAHSHTAGELHDLEFGRLIQHEEEFDLGQSPDGNEGWKLKAFHTPGHARGHVVFQENRYGALLAGDMLSTLSTIVIDPEDNGDMGNYMKSLDLLSKLVTGTIYPAHGPAVKDSKKLVETYIQHRVQRELKILQMLGNTPQTSKELVRKVYDDVDPGIWLLAEKSLRAGLTKLMKENKCKKRNNGYIL